MSFSDPVLRRNFITSSQKRRNNGSVIRIFFLSLITLVVALSVLAVHLSQRVMTRQSSSSLVHPPHSRALTTPSTAATITNDRVYCMIPFIWNPEIYHVIMEAWGKRCDTINFFADSIVGGQLEGDKILNNPSDSMGYKPYYEFPEGTFPDNVIFINMTRSWFDCEKDSSDSGRGGGVKKVCRHIWEKM